MTDAGDEPDWPPLTEEQRRILASLLRPAADYTPRRGRPARPRTDPANPGEEETT